jgi:hypothetical protein
VLRNFAGLFLALCTYRKAVHLIVAAPPWIALIANHSLVG